MSNYPQDPWRDPWDDSWQDPRFPRTSSSPLGLGAHRSVRAGEEPTPSEAAMIAAGSAFINDLTIRADAAYLIRNGVPIEEVSPRLIRYQRYVVCWGAVVFWLWFWAACALGGGIRFLIVWAGMLIGRQDLNPILLWQGTILFTLGLATYYLTWLALIRAWRRACAGIPEVDARNKWRMYWDKERGSRLGFQKDSFDPLRQFLGLAIAFALGSFYLLIIAIQVITAFGELLREFDLIHYLGMH